MGKHIVVTAANEAECIIFVDFIAMVQKATQSDGAFIYFSNEKATILTKDTYEEVLKKLGIGGSTKVRTTTVDYQ